jgi:hypothetical protein
MFTVCHDERRRILGRLALASAKTHCEPKTADTPVPKNAFEEFLFDSYSFSQSIVRRRRKAHQGAFSTSF